MKRLLALLIALLLPAAALAESGVRIERIWEDDEALRTVFVSPDESSFLMTDGKGALYIRRDGKDMPVYADESRGVPDQYGNLKDMVEMGIMAIGAEPWTWSPDGRYLSVLNSEFFWIRMEGWNDPMVIDTHTGGMFLLSTGGTDWEKPDFTATMATVFSEDSRYLYTVEYRGSPWDICLMRYELETGDATLIRKWFKEDAYCNGISLTAEGEFLLLWQEDAYNNEACELMLMQIRCDEQGIPTHTTEIKLLKGWSHLDMLCSSRRSGYSLISGWKMLTDWETLECAFWLMRLTPEHAADETGTYWVIPSLTAEAALPLKADELDGMARPLRPDVAADEPLPVLVRGLVLSPDGKQAALVCSEGDTAALLLLDLQDMSLTQVFTFDTAELNDAVSLCPMSWSGGMLTMMGARWDWMVFAFEMN